MVVVVASYYRLGLINIALRYTRFLNTLKYICMSAGFSVKLSFRFLLFFFLSLALSSFALSLSIFVSLRFRSYSPDLSVLYLLPRYLRIRAINSLITFFFATPLLLVRLSVFLRSSAPLLLLCSSYSASSALSSLPLLRGNLSLQRVSRSKLQSRKRKYKFFHCPTSRTTKVQYIQYINTIIFSMSIGNRFTHFCSRKIFKLDIYLRKYLTIRRLLQYSL